ncbi:hypothetical protein BVER_01827 [Candidatus Burkholderia verschuerenii]|uniref:Helicase HerA central domain-containing protein n=1 Tax=Candidatus Burkholderia verschuerenii TaxID=242163 RepID=A0A0L0MJ77_9BURK|nr:helicase HerA-like domain-containing protein [Candidatus Burkholderia verschuerenii]KND62346.1 hypothetical protein BVER_01827 [Candidatus Burkholderia verschuerenii]
MKIFLGYNDYLRKKESKDVPVYWDSETLINPHLILCGKSGTGKSYQLLRFIDEALKTAGPGFERYHNLDVHGDLIVPGESRVEFSRATRYGYNPLVLDPNPKSGGVDRQINFLISTINQTSRKLMDRQEACLRNILADVYAAYGIFEEEHDTWTREEMTEAMRAEMWASRRWSDMQRYYPTLEDAIALAERKLKAMYGGLNMNEQGNRAVAALEEMNRAAAQMNRAVTASNKKIDIEDKEKAQKQFEVAKGKYLERVTDYVSSIETGREFDDLIKYDSKEVLKGVIDRLKNLKAVGIFNGNPPPFDESARVWSYDLTNLDEEDKFVFAKVRAQHIARRRKLLGVQSEIKEIIGLDEAPVVFDDNPDSIYNRIAKQLRKFGLGLWCVAQTPSDFPEGVITTVSTKILLGIDSYYWTASCKKLNIDESVLKFITPQRTIAVYMDKKGSMNSKFNNVQLQ